MSQVSATVPDWERERCKVYWDPGRRLLRSLRMYQSWKARGGLWGPLAKLWVLSHRFWSAISGTDIPLNSRIGGGLLMPHTNGIVIHPHAEIGPNCLIFQQVTIGLGGPIPGAPRLGGHVDIGAGAKILGGVVIEDHVKIGANAVVIADVPAYATAVGVPARVILAKAEAPHYAPAPDRGEGDPTTR